jgi:hypothetical protein
VHFATLAQPSEIGSGAAVEAVRYRVKVRVALDLHRSGVEVSERDPRAARLIDESSNDREASTVRRSFLKLTASI